MSGEDWRGADSAELDWIDGVPHSARFKDTYFSRRGGVAESRYVFLAGNHLPQRWGGRGRFTIAETGFGTGLNFLTTWDAWRGDPARPGCLHYISIEAFPVGRADLERALEPWPEVAGPAAALLADYPPPLPGLHRLVFEQGHVCLDLLLLPLAQALPTLLELPDLRVDAWYLDGFAPARNPAMWTGQLFQAMASLGSAGSRFATFTAAGDVRRGLSDVGFEVQKVPGYGQKRDMLCGVLSRPAPGPAPGDTPWHLPRSDYPEAVTGGLRRPALAPDRVAPDRVAPDRVAPDRVAPDRVAPDRVLVLGAGLAGASVAEALQRRGWQAAVYDQGAVASGASGNPQGTLYTRISHRRSFLSEFSLHSYVFACRRYRALFDQGGLRAGRDGALCGALHLRPEPGLAEPLAATVASLPDLARWLSPADAAEISGLADCGAGLYYPDSGWLNPQAVCRALLADPDITVRENCGPLRLEQKDGSWRVLDSTGTVIDAADIAVVACGHVSGDVIGADWLRLQAIRGQTTQLPSRGGLRTLKTVICHEGYLPPALNDEHCIGATFEPGDLEPALRAQDHDANIAQLRRALPHLMGLPDDDGAGLEGRTGFRCASPDYLPLAGPVPDRDAFCEDYAALRRNARQRVPRAGSYIDGLYLSTGHGSRGLTSTPLTAELIAAQIAGEPWPLPAALARALSPARFLIRDLIRGRL